MYLKQGNNCKYVLKTPGLNETHSEFKSERALDNYIENLLNNDVTINGETAIFSVDRLSHTRSILDEITRDVESSARKVVIPRANGSAEEKNSIIVDEDGEISELDTYYKIDRSIGTTRLITTFGAGLDLSEGLITPFNLKSWED